MQKNCFNSYNEDMSHADLPQSSSYLSGNQLVLAQQGIDGALLSSLKGQNEPTSATRPLAKRAWFLQ